MADEVREILDVQASAKRTKTRAKTRPENEEKQKKRRNIPAGMRRELYYLLCDENHDDLAPVFPTDHGFKRAKAFSGSRRSVQWKWTPFTCPARSDNAVFHHWERVGETSNSNKNRLEKFNRKVPIPTYTDEEYEMCFQSPNWTRAETDHLFDLARRFDLRFTVMWDRWDRELYNDDKRSIESLKERFYYISAILEGKKYTYDADHETRRKEQLKRQYARTHEQEEEINYLREELDRIRLKRTEREKKQQVLQELIQAAETEFPKNKSRRAAKNVTWKNLHYKVKNSIDSSTGIKFREFKDSNIYPRSSLMRLPANISTRKKQIIENKVKELNILPDGEPFPIPTQEVCQLFNEVRSDMVLLHELQKGVNACEYELSLLKHECQILNSGILRAEHETSEVIDVVGDSPCATAEHPTTSFAQN